MLLTPIVSALLLLTTTPVSCRALGPPDPLCGGHDITVDIYFNNTMLIDNNSDLELFGDDHERYRTFRERAYRQVATKLINAGYSPSFRDESWKYSLPKNRGRPHHYIYFHIYGFRIDQPDCSCPPTCSFIVYSIINEDCSTADESRFTETYRLERMGYATDANLETRLLEVISYLIDSMLSLASCHDTEAALFRSANSLHEIHIAPPRFDCAFRLSSTEGGMPHYLASLYTSSTDNTRLPVSTFPLLNDPDRPPLNVLVSDNGEYVVTINDWAQSIVIYRSDGRIVRSLSMRDVLTASDISRFSSITSVDRWAQFHYLDSHSNTLVLRVPYCTSRNWPCETQFVEVRVDLSSGEPLQPVVDVLPRWRGRIMLADRQDFSSTDREASTRDRACSGLTAIEMAASIPVSLQDALSDNSSLQMPKYTNIAETALIEGTIHLELFIAPSGETLCARILKGLPMGLAEAARDTALSWNFRPKDGEELRRLSIGLTCQIVLGRPDRD